MKRSHKVSVFVLTLLIISLGAGAFFLLPPAVTFSRGGEDAVSARETEKRVSHIETPASVKAIYMSQCASGTPSFRKHLVGLIERTDLNAIVIDVKDYTGKLSFTPQDPSLARAVSDECGAPDMRAFIEELHAKQIYVIGRITVFQDAYYTRLHPELAVKKKSDRTVVWKDRKGLSFIDVGARPFWEYIAAIAKASYDIGFDELNFDYIRFPSDGNMEDIAYTWSEGKTKPQALEEFWKYLHETLKPTGAVLSADLFGMTASSFSDLNIGQELERAMPYFDYIAPMVYPSHYPPGWNKLSDPNEHPYEVVLDAMSIAVMRVRAATTSVPAFAYTRIGTSTPAIYAKPIYKAEKMRPWLQDFDYPVSYTPAMIRAQIEAVYDAGLDSYMFWDPSNKYDSLEEVLTGAR